MGHMMRGSILIPLLFIIIAFGVLLTSGAMVNKSAVDTNKNYNTSYSCCDTGNGDACKPQSGANQKIQFHGAEYGLLRTKTVLLEGNVHLKDSGEKYNNNPIIVNSSDTHIIPPQYATADCRTEPKDKYLKKVPPPPIVVGTAQSVPYCTSIPDDEIIFVCKNNCHPSACSPIWGPEVTCYGDKDSQYDAYFRLSDVSSPGIPDFIKNCDTSNLPTGATSGNQQHIITPTTKAGTKEKLQLNTFGINEDSLLVPWLSPFCKPAIYLYPESTIPVSVKINPLGTIKLTIPPYPFNGWNVLASPNGQISSQGKQFDYLYYEAEIADNKIEIPKKGYVVAQNELASLFKTLLPKLGLNSHEQNQFSEYWLSVLPKASFYFVGAVPIANLDTISPLLISPPPTTSIRVTLYFEPLDAPRDVIAPEFPKIVRRGFTMVEWGGIFKKTLNYPFSCFQ